MSSAILSPRRGFTLHEEAAERFFSARCALADGDRTAAARREGAAAARQLHDLLRRLTATKDSADEYLYRLSLGLNVSQLGNVARARFAANVRLSLQRASRSRCADRAAPRMGQRAYKFRRFFRTCYRSLVFMRQLTYDVGMAMMGWGSVRERYRTLGAMLALGDFSVAEIAALAQVGKSTVRTVLRREDDYVERVGTQRTGRRGGQPVRWRLRPGARESIRAILQELEVLGAGSWLDDPSAPDSPEGGRAGRRGCAAPACPDRKRSG